MEVLLLKNVDNLGDMGQMVTVRAGYARNYLIPKGFAVVANQSQRRVFKESLRQEVLRDKKRKRNAEGIAASHQELSCTITVQAGEDDRLFGSVTTRDIAAAMLDQEIEIDHKQVELEEPIKQLGVYSVPVRLHPEVEVPVKVWVVKA